MTLITWLSLLAVCCLGTMSPGPSSAVVLKHTVCNGRKHGFMVSWSHAVGVSLWALSTISGLTILITESELLSKGITWLGAAYLAWLGVKAISNKSDQSFRVPSTGTASIWQAGLDGAMISLLNPKLAVFFMALFSQLVTPTASWTELWIIIATVTLVDGIWYSLLTLAVSHRAILGALQEKNRLINRLTGGFLILLATRIVTL